LEKAVIWLKMDILHVTTQNAQNRMDGSHTPLIFEIHQKIYLSTVKTAQNGPVKNIHLSTTPKVSRIAEFP